MTLAFMPRVHFKIAPLPVRSLSLSKYEVVLEQRQTTRPWRRFVWGYHSRVAQAGEQPST
jgi:hypothetical protein